MQQPFAGSSVTRYAFNSHLVADLTSIESGGSRDYLIDRPAGMKGYVLHLTQRGEGCITLGDNKFICRAGDMLLFPPGVIHHYGRDFASKEWYHQWVYFHPRVYWKAWLEWETVLPKIGFFRPDEQHQAHFSYLFSQLITTANEEQDCYRELMASNFLEQILLKRMSLLTAEKSQILLDQRIVNACQYISNNLLKEKKLNIAAVADYVCLSPSRLFHLFRQQMGMTMLQWRDEQRMTLAKELLLTTQLSIANVAYHVGFDDQLYFSRVFKKYSGVSPVQYRSGL